MNIETIKTMRAAITPGPYRIEFDDDSETRMCIFATDPRFSFYFFGSPDGGGNKDAEFFAAAPEIVDFLLAEVTRLENEVEYLNSQMGAW